MVADFQLNFGPGRNFAVPMAAGITDRNVQGVKGTRCVQEQRGLLLLSKGLRIRMQEIGASVGSCWRNTKSLSDRSLTEEK
jgi:hypothetical protein